MKKQLIFEDSVDLKIKAGRVNIETSAYKSEMGTTRKLSIKYNQYGCVVSRLFVELPKNAIKPIIEMLKNLDEEVEGEDCPNLSIRLDDTGKK
jgi:hypothetical protein